MPCMTCIASISLCSSSSRCGRSGGGDGAGKNGSSSTCGEGRCSRILFIHVSTHLACVFLLRKKNQQPKTPKPKSKTCVLLEKKKKQERKIIIEALTNHMLATNVAFKNSNLSIWFNVMTCCSDLQRND
jgi:hypothetical protein